jgi:hypothetical protein
MPAPVLLALFVLLAMSLAGLVHARWLRSRWSRRFCVPLDGGATWRGRRILGDHKTVAGFVVIIPAAAAAFAGLALLLEPVAATALWPLSTIEYALLGAWAAFGFMAGELPNSLVKRQLGIAPGGQPSSPRAAVVASVVDRLDSTIGMLAALHLVVPVPVATAVLLLVASPAVHAAFSLLLFRWRVKARAA